MNYKRLSPALSSIICLLCLSGCLHMPDEDGLSLTRKHYGIMPDGGAVDQFTMANSNGLVMDVITYGCIITSIRFPDREGVSGDIVLGFDSLNEYLENDPYFGAIIGRFGNRIAKGKFAIDGKEFDLAVNNLGNHLHGGLTGFDKVVWEAEPLMTDESVGVKLTYSSPHLDEGYPGNLAVTVIYTLDDEDQITFEYAAITDAPTVVNLTNHSYYNLSAGASDIMDHQLVINGMRILEIDSTLIPVGMMAVTGTPFDFTVPKKVGRDLTYEHEQLVFGNGYDHCWVIDTSGDAINLAASLYDPGSGRFMEIYTTEPGIQFYSGNWLAGVNGKGGKVYSNQFGLCLETQHFPDSPNQPQFPSVILRPGEEYNSRTITRFSVK